MPPEDDRTETPAERADRNLVELLQELRVLQTGVQIVFAFLLTVAFYPRFERLGPFEHNTYVVTLLLTVGAAIVLATPVALHRGLFHCGVKAEIVGLSTRIAVAGLVILAMAITGAVLLVIDIVLGRTAALVIAGATAVAFALLWLVLPWRVRLRQR